MARKRKNNKEFAQVNSQLGELDIKINSFGEITNSIDIDKVNDFLNATVDDKKLRDRDDLDFTKDNKARK